MSRKDRLIKFIVNYRKAEGTFAPRLFVRVNDYPIEVTDLSTAALEDFARHLVVRFWEDKKRTRENREIMRRHALNHAEAA